jgi:hypothetical protein
LEVDVSFPDKNTVRNSLINALNYIPAVNSDFKYSDQFTFFDMCTEKFGDDGYIVAEISCKTTLAGYKKKFKIDDYQEKIKEFLRKLAEYIHTDLIDEAIIGINEYINLIKAKKDEAEKEYNNFLRTTFGEDGYTYEEILGRYVTHFLTYEELKSTLDYWSGIKMELDKEYVSSETAKLKKNMNEFNKIKNQLASHRYGYNINEIVLNNIMNFTLAEILNLSENKEFIEILKKYCETSINQAQSINFKADLGYVLMYKPMGGVSQESDEINIDYGDYQLTGKQLFSEYWSFS